MIEAGNAFEGMVMSGGAGVFRAPRNWWKLRNPLEPSWGEPYVEIAARMLAAVEAARDAARGHEAVLVSHQLPIWTLRLHVEGRRYAHDPRRRQCGLASVTSLTYDGDRFARRRRTPSPPAPPTPTRCPAHEDAHCSPLGAAVLLAGCATGGDAVDVNNGGEFRFVAGTPSGEVIPEGERASAPGVLRHAAGRRRVLLDRARPARSPSSTSGDPGARPAGWRRRSSGGLRRGPRRRRRSSSG